MQFNDKTTVLNSLASTYGISNKKANHICESLGISIKTYAQDLPAHKKDALNATIASLRKTKPGIDNELKLTIHDNIKRLIDMNSYRGRRHKAGLPTRGQRTRTNANTVKKNKNLKTG